MDKTKKKKVQMPSGIRSKLTAAIAMLLISSLLVVGSTYAWFTLSTAPEVTGITTSVGANGNLEIALLNNDTYDALQTIQSAVGNSYAATSNYTVSNVTWGNLVDLSTAYGLENIALNPASLNESDGLVNMGSMLKTPVYGADGRVATLNGTTVSAIYDSANGQFPYTPGAPAYGVRAIGATSTMTVRQIAFGYSKGIVNAAAAKGAANRGTITAVSQNLGALVGYATAGSAPDSYTDEDLAAFREIAAGVVSDIATLENAYKNAVIAKVATTAATDSAFTTLKNRIESAPLTELANLATEASLDVATGIQSLATAQTNAKSAKDTLDEARTSTAASTVTGAIKLLVGESPTKDGLNVYITTGAIGELAKQIGKFTIASVNGIGGAYAGASDAAATGYFNAADIGVVALVNGLTPPTGGATANITDTYGYLIDFAFRTNASSSNLLLQTAAANRVYADGSAATQGKGSNVELTYAGGLKSDQAITLLNAIKLAFIDPESGAIYAKASLTGVTANETKATANITLDSGNDVITALAQNTAKRVSVLVYLDGTQVDNGDVVNAANSGALKMNLQFASDANLQPMQNTALKTMPVTP